MFLRRSLLAAALVALLALPAIAQQAMSEENYDAAMKQVRATFGGVRDQVEAEAGADVAAAGKELAELFEKVEAFWEAREVESAIEISAGARDAALELQKAGETGNFEAAGEAFQLLRATCRGCHGQYREELADGSYRIKQGS